MLETLVRNLVVERGAGQVIYPFTVNADVFTPTLAITIHPLVSYLMGTLLKGAPARTLSVSSLTPYIVKTERVKKHRLIEAAKAANYSNSGKFQHEKVQKWLMQNDPYTIATEIPVWDDEMRGHIDSIAVLPDSIIEVSDFKPLAHKETKAACQVDRYIELLRKALNLPRKRFIGVYFDNKSAYIV